MALEAISFLKQNKTYQNGWEMDLRILCHLLPGNAMKEFISKYKFKEYFKEAFSQGDPKFKEEDSLASPVSQDNSKEQWMYLPFENRLRKALKHDFTGWNDGIEWHQCIDLYFGMDGVRCFKKSKNGLWVTFIGIVNMPIKLVTSLYLGPGHPNSNRRIYTVSEEITGLVVNGFSFHDRVIPLRLKFGILDLPAAAMAKNMKPSGYYACGKCFVKGVTRKDLGHGNDNTVVFPALPQFGFPACPRSHQQHFDLFNKARRDNFRHFYGVYGDQLSVLCNIPHFDMVKGFPYEALHSCFLGVVSVLVDCFFNSKNKREEFYIKPSQRLKLVDCFTSKNLPPFMRRRGEANVSELEFWKGADYRHFLLFTAPFLLPACNLPSKFVGHFEELAKIVYIASLDNAIEYVAELKTLCSNFLVTFGNLYGHQRITLAVHQLLHLPESVAEFGPLYIFSAFNAESFYGQVVKLFSSAFQPVLQIRDKLMLMEHLLNNPPVFTSPETEKLYFELLESRKLRKKAKTTPLDGVYLSALKKQPLLPFPGLQYSKCHVSWGDLLALDTEANQTIVMLRSGQVVRLKAFFKSLDDVIAVFNSINFIQSSKVYYFKKVGEMEQLQSVSITEIEKYCVEYTTKCMTSFIFPLPNTSECCW